MTVLPGHVALTLLILASCTGHALTSARKLQQEEEADDKSITESINDFFFDDYCEGSEKDTSRLSDLSNWMSTLDGSTQLTDITLPGTHHSASYDLSTTINAYDPEYKQIQDSTYGIDVPQKLIAPMICRFALTQSLSLSEQLQAGIRYFDLRVDYDDNEKTFRAFHVLFGLPLDVLLAQIADFVKEHPTEIVLLEISELLNEGITATDKANMQNTILDVFGDMLLPATDNLPTVGEMQDSKKTVIVVVHDSEIAENALLWSNSVIRNSFANTADLGAMISYNTERLAEFESDSSGRLFDKLSWTLTPDSEYIKDGIFFGSLYDLATEANGALQGFATDNDGKQLGNVLLLDYFEKSAVFDVLEISGKSEGEFQPESGGTKMCAALAALGLVSAIFHFL